MSTIHRLIYGGGAQTILHTPRTSTGLAVVVGSATYSIVDLRRSRDAADRVIQASTAATLDTVNTTISAAAGPQTADPRKLTVASATGITAGRRYLLTHATTGLSQPVRVQAVTGSVLLLAEPVAASYASSATFKGLEISGTFPSATADDAVLFDNGGGPYLVAWTYTAGGSSLTYEEVLFVERAASLCPATEADVRERFPEIGPATVGGQAQLSSFLHAGWLAARADLLSRGIDVGDLKPALLVEAVCVGTAARVARYSSTAAADRQEEWADLADRFDSRYKDMLAAMSRGRDRPGTVEISREDATASPGSSAEVRRRFLPR